jgi:hypothetical protein
MGRGMKQHADAKMDAAMVKKMPMKPAAMKAPMKKADGGKVEQRKADLKRNMQSGRPMRGEAEFALVGRDGMVDGSETNRVARNSARDMVRESTGRGSVRTGDRSGVDEYRKGGPAAKKPMPFAAGGAAKVRKDVATPGGMPKKAPRSKKMMDCI